MTQTPNPQRRRRADRYAQETPNAPRTPVSRPADISPVRKANAPKVRQPVGRSAELQARQERMRRAETADRSGPAYSDFSRYDAPQGNRPRGAARDAGQDRFVRDRRSQRSSHTLLWLTITVICLLGAGTLMLFALPQLQGVVYQSSPNFAFVNGGLLFRDQSAIDAHEAAKAQLLTDRICHGVYIDDVYVGGMTKEEAAATLARDTTVAGSTFDIGVSIDGYTWSINSDNVPTTRNIDEVVARAYAIGRRNTASIRGTSVTPFRQRLSDAQEVYLQPVGLYTVTTYDRNVVRAIVEEIARTMSRAPVNASVASFDQRTKEFTFHSDEPGVIVEAEPIYQEIIAMLDGGVYAGTVYAEPAIMLADVTRSDLVGRFGRISSFTTKKTGDSNRTTNIALSAQAINGITVLPGEQFSFNQATGQRTPEKGYKAAAAIAGGEVFDDYGGGVCQTSSTLFNAVVRANLAISSRKPHAWPSDYVDMGEDATVNWPNLDFKFTNNTEWPVFIVAWCDKSAKTVTVEIYGRLLPDGVSYDLWSEVVYEKRPPSEPLYVYNPDLDYGTEKVTVKARTGYRVETYLIKYVDGAEDSRILLHTSDYKMYQKTIQHNKPYEYGT